MLYLVLVAVFASGVLAGAVINFCADRLPYEKSLLWPAPRCLSCLQRIRWYDQIPLLSYFLLGRRCRTCSAPIPVRGFLVELFTGLAFVALFYLEIVNNCMGIPLLARQHPAIVEGQIEPRVWAVFGCHALLLSFLILVSVCDLEHLEIPLAITVTGTVVGMVGAVLFPWPFPNAVGDLPRIPPPPPGIMAHWVPPRLPSGVYPWPVWYPLPSWMRPGSWQLGLATGLAGMLAGMLTLRAIRFLFGLGRGIEGLGMGDADLMMMAGSFLGWQAVLLGFFLGVFAALFFAVVHVVRRGDKPLAFAPPLCIGIMATLLLWPYLSSYFQPIFFEAWILIAVAILGAVLLLATSFGLRLFRGKPG